MINIYNVTGEVLLRAELTSAAKWEQEMSKTNQIQLSFSAVEKKRLPAGAYIEYSYKVSATRKATHKFMLLDEYEPTQSNEQSWKYTPEFQHPVMLLSKIPFYINTKNSQNEDIKQTNWSFVGTPQNIMGKVCDFLNNDIMFGQCGWTAVVTDTLSNNLSVSFSDLDVMSALTSISNALDNCEWHIDYDDEIIYLGRVVIGNYPSLLKVGENVGSAAVSSNNEGYYNAFTVWGGTRNITQKNNNGEYISAGDIRLQLQPNQSGSIILDSGEEQAWVIPQDSTTIDIRSDRKNEPLMTEILEFSDIYPSLNTYAYNVRGRQKYVLDENDQKIPLTYNADGTASSYKTFTVWYMRLAYCTTTLIEGKILLNTTQDEDADGSKVTHYWYDFEITDNLIVSGKTLSCSFEANFNADALSTPLAGRGTNGDYVGFELTYHSKAYSSHASDDVNSENFEVLAGDYEIIYQEEDEVYIPSNASEMLIPRGEEKPSLRCNIALLYNIAMADSYIADAQKRLLDVALKEIKRLRSDLSNYSFKAYPQVFLKNNPLLKIGQYVTFDDGCGYSFDTRILKLSTNIDYDFVQEITVGNEAIKGTITQLKEDVQSIIASAGNSGNGTYTVAQLRNLIQKNGADFFLSKKSSDVAQGRISFKEGLDVGEAYKIDKDGAAEVGSLKVEKKYGIGRDGKTVLGTVTLDSARDPDSGDEDRVLTGAQGFDLYRDEQGNSHLWIDYLSARRRAYFASLEVRKVSYAGGTTVFSNAGSTIVKVVELRDSDGVVSGYKCYSKADDGTTRTANWWHVGMQALCQTFNVKSGVYDGVANKYYWRLVVDCGQEELGGETYDYVTLSNAGEEFGVAAEVVVDAAGTVRTLEEIIEEKEGADAATAAAGLTFLGKDTSGVCDAPGEGDVIVQVGDQLKPAERGNVVKITTSVEDGGVGGSSIDMYSGIDRYAWSGHWYHAGKDGVRIQAAKFMLTSGDVDEDGETVSEYVEGLVGHQYRVETDSQLAVGSTGSNGTVSTVASVTGLPTEVRLYDNNELVAPEKWTQLTVSVLGTEYKLNDDSGIMPVGAGLTPSMKSGAESVGLTWSLVYPLSIEGDGYELLPGEIVFTVAYGAETVTGRTTLAVTKSGANGTSVSIKGSLGTVDDLGSVENPVLGDGWLIDGYLWIYTGTDLWDDTHQYGFENAGQIQGKTGESAWQFEWSASPLVISDEQLTEDSDHNFTVAEGAETRARVTAKYGTQAATVTKMELVSVVNVEMDEVLTGWWYQPQTLKGVSVSEDGKTVWLPAGKAEATLRVAAEAADADGVKVASGDVLVTLPIVVQYVERMAKLEMNDEKFSVRVSEAEASVDGVAKSVGELEVTAKGISAKVTTLEDGLLATGIDITNRKVEVTADQFNIKNNAGGRTFSVDDTGRVTMKEIALGGMINKSAVEIASLEDMATYFEHMVEETVGLDLGWDARIGRLQGLYYFTSEFKGDAEDGTAMGGSIYLPYARYYEKQWYGVSTKAELMQVRQLVGNTIIIYNDSDVDITVKCMSKTFTNLWLKSSGRSSAASAVAKAASTGGIVDDGNGTETVDENPFDDDSTSGYAGLPVKDDSGTYETWLGRKREEMTVTLKGGKQEFVSLECVCESGVGARENVYWIGNFGIGDFKV